ncbi:MAG: hypothetical protein B7Z42_02820 [Brevundimonas sp. 12-68-7]|nr:MAG: hypothetical protein B7Z42_02820 [Brevundimonas sp. 12-68-7]
MRAGLRALGVAALLGAAACAAVATSTPSVAGPERAIRLEANRTPLGIGGATLAPGVRYAGGLTLRGPGLHGLSDLKIQGDVAWAVSDFGHLIRFTLGLDGPEGRLVSADQGVRRELTDTDGIALRVGPNADAEGLAILPDGRVLVSFEREHRIWSYGADANERPVAVAAPDTPLPHFFTGADRDPAGDGWFVVERLYRPPLTLRARVRRLSADGVLSAPLIELRPPALVDNFEGIAAVATPGGTRLYLLSDDNGNPLQKTLLLAFDLDDPSPLAGEGGPEGRMRGTKMRVR